MSTQAHANFLSMCRNAASKVLYLLQSLMHYNLTEVSVCVCVVCMCVRMRVRALAYQSGMTC